MKKNIIILSAPTRNGSAIPTLFTYPGNLHGEKQHRSVLMDGLTTLEINKINEQYKNWLKVSGVKRYKCKECKEKLLLSSPSATLSSFLELVSRNAFFNGYMLCRVNTRCSDNKAKGKTTLTKRRCSNGKA